MIRVEDFSGSGGFRRWFGRRTAAAAAKKRMDARHQFAHTERFDHIIIRPGIKSAQAVRFRRARRQQQNRKRGILAMQPAAEVQSVSGRQHDIEQNQIRVARKKSDSCIHRHRWRFPRQIPLF